MGVKVFYKGSALKSLDQKLANVAGPGAKRLADAITKEIVDGNARDRLAGVDRYGKAVTPLKSKRRGIYKGATGKPLVPDGRTSRAIAGFKAVAKRTGDQWRIVAGWDATDAQILAFHSEGSGHNPIRNIAGISPQTWVEIRKQIKLWKQGWFSRKR